MTPPAGGHYLDTGDGPVRLNPDPDPGPVPPMVSTETTDADGRTVRVVHAEGVPLLRPLAGPRTDAWHDYLAHQAYCPDCPTPAGAEPCEEGTALWDLYTLTRGAL